MRAYKCIFKVMAQTSPVLGEKYNLRLLNYKQSEYKKEKPGSAVS